MGIHLISLDVHGGTTELDVLNVFETASAAAAQGGGVFVFLDEINTCQHMGIITEGISTLNYCFAYHNMLTVLIM